MAEAPPKIAITGTQIMHGLIDAARALGYMVHHETDSRKTDPGFPDLLIVGHGHIFIFECKSRYEKLRPATVTKKGRYLPGQEEWLQAFEDVEPCDLTDTHITAGVVRAGAPICGIDFTMDGYWLMGYEDAIDCLQEQALRNARQTQAIEAAVASRREGAGQ